MYELYYETEKVVSRRVQKIENNLHMKEEEVVRLKQILYGKEDDIRKVSIAYEQAKGDMESYIEQIDYLQQKLQDYEGSEHHQLVVDNKNLRIQNKQLLSTLMNHLTRSHSRKGSKKKNRLSGTLVSNSELRKRKIFDHSSKRSQSKYKKRSHRKSSSKRRLKGEYRNVPSLRSINKNMMNANNNNLINNYQSFDTTLNKAMMENFVSSVKNSASADGKENSEIYADKFRSSGHHISSKTPQIDKRSVSSKRKARPKTAVRREKNMNQNEDMHSSSLQVPYESAFGHQEDGEYLTPQQLEELKEEIRKGNISFVDNLDPNNLENYYGDPMGDEY